MSRTLIIALLFSFVLVVFAMQNAHVVDIDLYFWHYESSLAIVVLVSFLIGAFVGILFSFPGYFKKKKEIKELKQELEIRIRPSPASKEVKENETRSSKKAIKKEL